MSDERYEIRDKLGQGGVGAVYKAFDTQLNREVAIKRVLADGSYENQEEATKHLLKEATALSSVQHPHIVTVYDAGVDADGPYVVMELIHGKTLDEMVERGTLTWNDLREIALQSQEALIAAQDLDLVHRDLKPSNVMVCWLPSGKFQVKIVDFGLAKFSATPSLQTIDHGDAVFGSIFFMAPEQFERTPLDKRTDMYAMGCLYYYSLTGEYPFSGETAAAVMASHLQHHVTPLHELRPDIPRWGADWVMWHIERGMDGRPADARAALERFLFLDKQSTQPVTLTASQAAAAPGAAQPATGPGGSTVDPQTSPQRIAPPQDSDGKVTPHTQSQQIALQSTASQTANQAARAPATATTAQPLPSVTTAENATATTQATTLPNQSGGLSKNGRLIIIAVLALAVIIGGIVSISVIGNSNEAKNINKLMVQAKSLDDEGKLQDGISLDKKQLDGLLKRATSVESNDQRALILKTLAYARSNGDFDVDQNIIEHITTAKCPESTRADLFRFVMSRRKSLANVAPLLAYAKNSSEEKSAAAAIDAAHKSAMNQPADGFISDFLGLIKDTQSSAIRISAEQAATSLIAETKNKRQFSKPIAGAYRTAITNDAKYAMLRLSGAAGGSENSKIVRAALDANDVSLNHAAITALGQWADTSEFETLTTFIDEADDDTLRKRAFDSAYTFLQKQDSLSTRNKTRLWKALAEVAYSEREKIKISSSMVKQKEQWAMTILDTFSRDADSTVRDYASKAKDKLQRHIENK